MAKHELERFLDTWETEAGHTIKLLKALPADQYDFRPDPEGRSLGEMAWHLAEGDGYMTHGIEKGTFAMGDKPPGMERPRTVAALAPGYERIHQDAVARVKKLKPEDLDRTLPFFDGRSIAIRDVLWDTVLHHLIHHRAQLQMMARLSGSPVPAIYGPNREQTVAMKAQAQAKA